MPTQKSARQIVMEDLNKEIRLAMTADLHRAANLLKGAREIRAGSKNNVEYPGKDTPIPIKERSIDL